LRPDGLRLRMAADPDSSAAISRMMSADKQTRFAAIFRQYSRAVQRYLRRRVHSREAAEDLTQEAFARVYASDTEALESPRNFLFRTAHNLAVNHRRDQTAARVRAVEDVDALGVAHQAPLPEETLHWREELALLERVIDSLPSQCRQVFILQKIELLSHQEIAARLGIAVSTVEKHIAKAVKICYRRYREREHGR
jgi:RNA polymerase sigma factor (sigma-70 family)